MLHRIGDAQELRGGWGGQNREYGEGFRSGLQSSMWEGMQPAAASRQRRQETAP